MPGGCLGMPEAHQSQSKCLWQRGHLLGGSRTCEHWLILSTICILCRGDAVENNEVVKIPPPKRPAAGWVANICEHWLILCTICILCRGDPTERPKVLKVAPKRPPAG